jgi:hypothetical protein
VKQERQMNSKHKIAAGRGWFVRCVGLSMIVLALPMAAADPKSDGLTALKKGDFQQAYKLFLQGVESQKGGNDNKQTADLLFYLGFCLQELAARTADDENRAGLLGEAAMYYDQALGLNPKSSSILNNLAQIYIQQGATGLAQETLAKAIALGDANQAFHVQNYADLLATKGEWKEAGRFYALALWTQPDNVALLKKLVDLYLKNDRAFLGSYLWDMTERGQILQAQEVALSVFPRAEWSQAQKEELLAIVAVCLGKQTYDPREFLKTQTAQRLRDLYEDGAVSGGAREIVHLYESNEFHAQDFEWWKRRINPFKQPPRGKWPLQAFQELIRSIGEYYKTKEQPQIAENYLRLAIDIHELAPDIPSLVALADLYARQDRQGALRDLIRTKEDTLFGEKARAYQEHNLDEIYALHRALGSIYSLLGQWGGSSEPTSAIFQLEHALNIARQAQRTPEGKPIAVDAALVDRLATGYQKTDHPAKAFKLRLDAAEDFQKAGNNEAAAAVFAPIQQSLPPKDVKARYETLKLKLESGSGSAAIEKSEFPVRVSAKSQGVEDQRQEQKLTVKEVGEIQKSVGDLLTMQRPQKSRARTIQVLPPKGMPPGVREIDLEEGRGRVILEKDAKTVEVPFTIETVAAQKAPSVRYIKP